MSWMHELFQNLVLGGCGDGCHRTSAAARHAVVDVGCGPAVVRKHLPADIQYVGFDISEKYITTARRKYGNQGTFLVGTAEDFIQKPDARMRDADLVICTGLLHHLVDDEETLQILNLAKMILRPGAGLEPISHLPGQFSAGS
ncbi:MAG: class I SAM-dependent methyltransferase [Gemmataceae bacterium]